MPALRPLVAPVIAVVLVLSACGSGDESATGAELGPEASALVLTADGIGPYLIGHPFDDVRNGIAGDIGGWDIDSDDRPDAVHVPTCAGDVTRLVGWGNLTLLFTGDQGSLTFATWTYGFDPLTGSAEDVRVLGLVTPEGIGPGSTRADIESAYGDLAFFSDATQSIGTIVIIGDESEPHLQGRLEDDRLVLLERSPTCTV
jgi:hypothetical protein